MYAGFHTPLSLSLSLRITNEVNLDENSPCNTKDRHPDRDFTRTINRAKLKQVRFGVDTNKCLGRLEEMS